MKSNLIAVQSADTLINYGLITFHGVLIKERGMRTTDVFGVSNNETELYPIQRYFYLMA